MSLVYNWDFGDGSTSTDVNPSHTYLYPGKYTTILTIYDDTDMIRNIVTKIFYIYVYDVQGFNRKTNTCFCFGINTDELEQTQK